MFSEEWPLMMFTLVSQLAIGSFLLLMLTRTLLERDNPQLAHEVFHLGTPLGAYRSILNLGSSWLSREILTAGGFFILWFLYCYFYRKAGTGKALGWLTAVVGLAAIFSMASIYDHSIRPAWANVNTFIAFYGATLALGSAGAGLSVVGKINQENSSKCLPALQKTALLGLLGVLLPLFYFPVFVSGLGQAGAAGSSSAALLAGYTPLLILRWLLSCAGAVLLLLAFYRKAKSSLPANWLYLVFVLLLLGEFLGRYAFYGSAVSITVGLS